MIPSEIENIIFKLRHEIQIKRVLVELITNVDNAREWYKEYSWEDDDEYINDNISSILFYYKNENTYRKPNNFFSIKTMDIVVKDLKSYWFRKNKPNHLTSGFFDLATYDEQEKYMYKI